MSRIRVTPNLDEQRDAQQEHLQGATPVQGKVSGEGHLLPSTPKVDVTLPAGSKKVATPASPSAQTTADTTTPVVTQQRDVTIPSADDVAKMFPVESFVPKGTDTSSMTREDTKKIFSGYQQTGAKPTAPTPLVTIPGKRIDTGQMADVGPESAYVPTFSQNQIDEAKVADEAFRNGQPFTQPSGVGEYEAVKFKTDVTSRVPTKAYERPNPVISQNARNPLDDKGNPTQTALESAKRESRSILDPSDKHPSAIQDAQERRAKDALRRLSRGGRVYGKLMAANKFSMFVKTMLKLGLRDVAVGKLEILEAARSNPEYLNQLFTKAVENKEGSVAEPIDVSDWGIEQFIAFTNKYQVWVATYKAPDPAKGDCVLRRLRIADWADRGVFIHSIVAALSNADIDGDDMMVSFDPNIPSIYADPMETIFGPDKSLKLDLKFFPPPFLFSGRSEAFVKGFIESAILNKLPMDKAPAGYDTERLVSAIASIGYATNNNEYEQAWYDLVDEAHDFAGVVAGGSRRRTNAIMANVILRVYEVFQDLNREQNYLIVGNNDVETVVPLLEIPAPRTRDFDCLVWLVGEVSKAGDVPNFQELRTMMHMYLGLNPGTNAPFRQLGNVGKAVKMDPSFMQDDGTYLIDINNDNDMRMFRTNLSAYCYGMKMQHEQNKKGREFNLYNDFVSTVRSKVGYRGDMNEDGEPRYKSTLQWLWAFCDAYGETAAMYNMASANVRYDMSVDDRKDTNVIKPLVGKNGVISIGDVRTALSQVYPSNQIGRMFPSLLKYMNNNMDPRFAPVINTDDKKAGRAHPRRNWWNNDSKGFWIDSSFKDMTVINFMNENQLVRKDNDIESVLGRPITFDYTSGSELHRKIGADAALEWDLLVGIADRRTSAASKFNEKTYGKIGEPGSTETRAGMIASAASEILALNEQGVVFQSNYYAGIGSRTIPQGERGDELRSAIKGLAADLAGMGYMLRSGGAEGCDTLFHEGAGKMADIYFAEKPNKYKLSGNYHVFTGKDFSDDERQEAYLSVDRLHPNPKALGDYERNLMARNYYQVVGQGDLPDVGFVACYAPTSGGTSQAIRIAEQRGIRVFNAAEYDDFESWRQDVLRFAREHKGYEYKFRRRFDENQMAYANAASKLIISAGADYFNDLCGGTPEGLLSSSWTVKLMQHSKNVKVTGGILLAVVYQHHIETLNRLAARIPSEREGKAAAYMYTYNQWAFQYEKLKAKSPAWRGILMEMTAQETEGERSFFDMMLNSTAEEVKERVVQTWGESWARNPETKWLEHYEATPFWKDRGVIEINGRKVQHPTLASLIMDLDVSVDLKQQVICDVVRWQLKNPYIQPYEIGYMMEIGNDGAFELGDVDRKSALQTFYDTSQAYTEWKRNNIVAARDNYRLAAARHKNVKGALIGAIEYLDKHPWDFIDIPDEVFAQALIAVKDPTYGQTEKNSQHEGAHALFQALSRQLNDGYFCITDIVQDRLLGITPVGPNNRLSARDLISLLADGSKSFTYYGPYGGTCRLNRDLIISEVLQREPSEDVEADLWAVFEKMPTLMMAIRRHKAGLSPGIEGNAYVGASENTASTISYANDSYDVISPWNSIQAVKYHLRDEPAYGAIISLVTGSPDTQYFDEDNKVYRRVPTVPVLEISRLMDTETYFCNKIANAAWSQGDPHDEAIAILDDMGASYDAIRGALETSFDKFCDHNDIPYIENEIVRTDKKTGEVISRYDERDDVAHQIHDYAVERLTKMIEAIKRSNDVLPIAEPVSSHYSYRSRVAEAKTIDLFRGDHFFLSNMYKTPVTYDGITYQSAEAAFQAQKYALGTKDRKKKQQEFARKHTDPFEAKKAGGRIRAFDKVEWDNRKVEVMRDILNVKFSDPVLRKMLMDTGDAQLVEGNTHNDTFWGKVDGKGKNVLGELLMEIRGDGGIHKPAFLGVDAASVASFNHVAVELSGSKTATMVGVEGAQTWTYGHWASYITSKDAYADLGWVLDDIDESWNGMWTSVKDDSGNTMYLEVTEQGSNVDELLERAGNEEVSVRCPDGYTVRDAYTDEFNNIDSVAAFNNTRRADGAEKNALKIKKTGLDLLNSIVKIDGKRKTINGSTVDLYAIRAKLRDIYDSHADKEQGLAEAKLELAKEMQAENKRHGYDDLALGQYMSIADLMVFVVEDPASEQNEQLFVRTLPMLFTAIKYKAGGMWAEMNTEEKFDFANSIAYDRTAAAVGVEEIGPMEVLAAYYAASKAGSTWVVKGSSSFFPRNLSMIETLTKDKKQALIDDNMAAHAHNTIMKTSDIRSIVRNAEFARHHDVVFARAIANREESEGARKEEAEKIAAALNVSVMTVGGPTRLAVIGSQISTKEEVAKICRQCWKYGLDLLVHPNNVPLIPDEYINDAMVPQGTSSILLPMYELRLNGSEAHPVFPSYSMFIMDPSNMAQTIADPDNAYSLPDSGFAVSDDFAERAENLEIKPLTIAFEELFPNVYKNPKYPNHTYSKKVTWLTNDELSKYVLGDTPCTKDYNAPYIPGSKVFEQKVHDFEIGRQRYEERWTSEDATKNGWVMSDIRKGDVVAWAKCVITNKFNTNDVSVVIAPVIPFPQGKKGKVPETCYIVGMKIAPGSAIEMTYAVHRTLKNTITKIHGVDSNANKGMVDGYNTMPNLTFQDGSSLDVVVASATTAGRKEGTENRLMTLYSVMMKARIVGYNLAFAEGSFPDHPDLKERVMRQVLPLSEWRELLDGNGVFPFTGQHDIDVFLTGQCREFMMSGHNPSHLLASVFLHDNDNKLYNTGLHWEYDAMIQPDLRYENLLLKWLNYMKIDCGNNKMLCPDGIYDDSRDGYLFALKRSQGFDKGVIQIAAPFLIANQAGIQSVSYRWVEPYFGLLKIGKDSTANSASNVDGARVFPDSLTTAEQLGFKLPEHIRKLLGRLGSSEFGLPGTSLNSIEVEDEADSIDDEPQSVNDIISDCTSTLRNYFEENESVNIKELTSITESARMKLIDAGLSQTDADNVANYLLQGCSGYITS